MIRTRALWWMLLAIPVPALFPAAMAAATPPSDPIAPSISMTAFRTQLESLDRLVAACQQSLQSAQSTAAAHCSGDQVGPDIQVALPSGARPVHYGWLRDLLNEAAKPPVKQAATKPAKDKPKSSSDSDSDADPDTDTSSIGLDPAPLTPMTIAQRLAAARTRLQQDWAITGKIASTPATDSPQPTHFNSSKEHAVLTRILAAREYQSAVIGRTLKDRILEKIGNWIDKVIGKLVEAGSKSKWIGLTAEIGFVSLLCVLLVWFLIRIERQGRFSTSLFRSTPGGAAASARDWQLWLQDARQAAAQGKWRDAIHLLYWASISRLESSGQWPADRARTPREYLALLNPESAQRPTLTALTRSFERTWYAGHTAAEADFRQAEQLAGRLGAQ
ncbi:DUF4129 domain-containing protein [Acidicapsa ligni]|uniref:DUF4129 domain-containing protein n=1 Tax=Acidicapsa ligni TaxID=542300 RepID=UPI0021DF5E3E|nr:DUF4129 domain-containing protein [Acidicapsa ligni]